MTSGFITFGAREPNIRAPWQDPCGAAEALKRFAEEGLDVVRLQTARFRPHHVLSYALYAACVHGVVRKGTLFQQVLESAAGDEASRR